jgi:hypothetical protein
MTMYLGALLAIGLVVLGIGAWLVWRDRARGTASRTWPSAEGIIKTSRVVTHDADGIDMYVAEVRYDYNVHGKTYTGDRLGFGHYAGTQDKARQDVDKYAVGRRVDVRYAPRQPQTSTLEVGATGVNVAGMALAAGGAAMLVVAAAVAIFA